MRINKMRVPTPMYTVPPSMWFVRAVPVVYVHEN